MLKFTQTKEISIDRRSLLKNNQPFEPRHLHNSSNRTNHGSFDLFEHTEVAAANVQNQNLCRPTKKELNTGPMHESHKIPIEAKDFEDGFLNTKLSKVNQIRENRDIRNPMFPEDIELRDNSRNVSVKIDKKDSGNVGNIDVINTTAACGVKTNQTTTEPAYDKNWKPEIDNNVNDNVIDQSDRLKKYEDDLSKKWEAEMRQAAESEFLRSSLRGSKKLRALEEGSSRDLSCHENDAFEAEETATNKDTKSAEFREILLSIHKLNQENPEYDTDFATSQSALNELSKPKIQNILRITHLIRSLLGNGEGAFQPVSNNAASDAEEVARLLAIHESNQNIPELLSLLKKNEFKCLLQLHDEEANHCLKIRPSTSSDYADIDLVENYYVYRSDCFGLKETSFRSDQDSGVLRIIKLIKDGDLPLGATVKNEGDSVIISRIIKGGVVEKSGLLREGDEIVDINGCDLRGKSVHDVCDILANMSGEVTLIIAPAPPETQIDSVPHLTIKHVRALFNYEPEEDPYLPCRELGLHFAKGDILHVISVLDPNWWQALRDGEENVQQLAGLVPSAALQEKKMQYEREAGLKEGPLDESYIYRKSLLICTRGLRVRTLSRKKNSVLRDQDDEIPTYEEVALYLSPKGRRRPLILVGPPNIGCLELRRKLIESDKDLFSGVVPHTTRPKRADEQDGVHYHFVSKIEFQEEVRRMNFVEWGEYQKFYYGTSYDAVTKVIERGKTCVLTLKIQSIKNIRHADFKPFVVFVAPPSLERLKLNKRRTGEKDVKEDELRAIIYEAKESEESYGYLFDKILVNYDIERAYQELRTILHRLETEPQWVPCDWLKDRNGSLGKY